MSSAADVMKLGAILDLGSAEALLLELRQRTQLGDALCLDASEVETLTLPCAQLILSAATGGGKIAIINPSAAFDDAFKDLGLAWPQDESIAALAADTPSAEPAHIEAPSITPEIAPREETTPSTNQGEAAAMTKRVLTIDDSKTIRDMLRMTLVDAGFEVLQAVDGQDGCEVMDRETVDLVITDINMPRMNGYEVVRNLRNRPELKGLPILVLTTESDTDKKNLAREAGATGWMVKPFDPDRLIATVRKVIP